MSGEYNAFSIQGPGLSRGRRYRDCMVVGFTLPIQLVPITTDVVSSNPVQVYNIM